MSVELHLRETFEANAERAVAPRSMYAAVLARHQHSQRRRVAASLVGVSAALVLIAPTIAAVDYAAPAQGPMSDSGLAAGDDTEPGPARGSLADDADFIDGVLRAPWGAGPDSLQPPVADRRVVFAGDVLGGRWARVVAKVQGAWMGVWLDGPAEARADELTIVDEPTPVDFTLPQSEYDLSAPGRPLVVLAQPADEVSYSLAPVVAEDGSVARSFVPVATADGIALLSLPASTGTVAIRVFRSGEAIYEGSAQGGAGGPDDHEWTVAEAADASVGVRGESLADAEDGTYPYQLPIETMSWLTAPTGLAPSMLEPRVLWAGSAGGFDSVTADLLVMTARMPSGATAMIGGFWAAEPGIGGLCMMQFLPRGSSVDDRLTAMQCDVQQDNQGPGVVSELAVLAPLEATTAEIFSGQIKLASISLDAGAGVAPMPSGADRVVALDAAGAVVGDELIAPITDLSFSDEGDH